jgi:hypothetical protein
MEDADPFEGECTKRSLMGATALAVAFIEGLGPEGTRDGLANPLDEGLALKGWAGEAPVDPVLAALRTRANLAPRNGFQARFSALGLRRLARAAALAAERSLASLNR